MRADCRAASNPDNDTDVEDIAGSFIPLVPASSVAVLRTRGGLTPLFLVVLLRSPAYRSWFSGHARGTTIRRLALRTLRRLRIPVPPVPVQEAVLREVPNLRGDAMAVLARLLSGASNDPLTVWLETPVVNRLASGSTEGNEADRLGVLVAAAEAIQSLVVRTTHRSDSAAPEIDDRQVGAWLDVVRQAAAALDGVASIPRGAGRLTVVGVALARLLKALDILDKAEGPVVDRLYSFTRAMVELCEDEIHAMQESITLDIGVEPAEVIVGAISEVRLRLTNASAVPLWSLHVSTRPSAGTGQAPYLADGETHFASLSPSTRAKPLGRFRSSCPGGRAGSTGPPCTARRRSHFAFYRPERRCDRATWGQVPTSSAARWTGTRCSSAAPTFWTVSGVSSGRAPMRT